VSLCAFVLAALFAERRQHEAVLMESEARLQEALKAGAVTAFDWDVRTGSSSRSDNAARILGFDPRQPFGATRFLAQVHPDDRARFKALVLKAVESQQNVDRLGLSHQDNMEALLSTVRFEHGRLVEVRVHPVDVGKGVRPLSKMGIPMTPAPDVAREILERHRHAQRALNLVLAHQIEHRVELIGEFGKIDVAVRINQHVRLPAIHRASMLHTTAAIAR